MEIRYTWLTSQPSMVLLNTRRRQFRSVRQPAGNRWSIISIDYLLSAFQIAHWGIQKIINIINILKFTLLMLMPFIILTGVWKLELAMIVKVPLRLRTMVVSLLLAIVYDLIQMWHSFILEVEGFITDICGRIFGYFTPQLLILIGCVDTKLITRIIIMPSILRIVSITIFSLILRVTV
jgi:hypothetical protein